MEWNLIQIAWNGILFKLHGMKSYSNCMEWNLIQIAWNEILFKLHGMESFDEFVKMLNADIEMKNIYH